MMMRRTLLTLAVLFAALLAVAQKPLYKDVRQPIGKRVDDLMQRMTLEEKSCPDVPVCRSRTYSRNAGTL